MKDRKNQNRNELGFTLIELLIVLIILAVLAGIVVFAVGTTGSNSRYASCSADAKSFETALESYKAEVGVFPGDPTLTQGQTVTPPVPEVGNGQTWSKATPGSGSPLTGEVFGLLGNDGTDAAGATVTASSGDTWTTPDGVTVGPFLRQLPATTYYQIVTDGQGGVFVYPPGQAIPDSTANGMDHETVGGVTGNGSTASLSFETNPGICSNSQIVQ